MNRCNTPPNDIHQRPTVLGDQVGVGTSPMGPTSTNHNNIDLTLKENDNEDFLNCLQKIEKNSTRRNKNFPLKTL